MDISSMRLIKGNIDRYLQVVVICESLEFCYDKQVTKLAGIDHQNLNSLTVLNCFAFLLMSSVSQLMIQIRISSQKTPTYCMRCWDNSAFVV